MKVSDLQLRLQFKRPDTRSAAYQTALDRVHERPHLAMAILARNDFSRHDRLSVIVNIRERMEYPRPLFSKSADQGNLPLAEMSVLPPFFRLLARQRSGVVAEVRDLWAMANNEFGPPRGRPHDSYPNNFAIQAEQYLRSFSSGYHDLGSKITVPVTARAAQTFIVYGYHEQTKPAEGEKFLILATGCLIGDHSFNYEFQA